MRLGLSHKELDSLIHGLDEIVEVYRDDVEMQREAGNDFIVWSRLLRRAEHLRNARNAGELCAGCGGPRAKLEEHRDADPVMSSDLALGESLDREAREVRPELGSKDAGKIRRMTRGHGPELRDELEGTTYPDSPESRTDSSSEPKSWFRRWIEAPRHR